MRRYVLLATLVLLLAGCGGSGMNAAKVETLVQSKQVATLFTRATGLVGVSAASCQSTALPGNYDCTGKPTYTRCAKNAKPSNPCQSKTAPTEVWIDCYPTTKGSADKLFCNLVNAPSGTDPFVTRAQLGAAKQATWKCEGTEPGGVKLGPFMISIAKSFGPTETRPEFVTKANARTLARSLHLPLRVECK